MSSPDLLSRRRPEGGFTFVEVLAAMLFMAIVIPVTVEAILLSSRVGVTAQRKREAGILADRQLSELLVTREWIAGNESGDFGTEWPGFRWELTTEAWSEDTMRMIKVSVFYLVKGQEYSEELSTVADPNEDEGMATPAFMN